MGQDSDYRIEVDFSIPMYRAIFLYLADDLNPIRAATKEEQRDYGFVARMSGEGLGESRGDFLCVHWCGASSFPVRAISLRYREDVPGLF